MPTIAVAGLLRPVPAAVVINAATGNAKEPSNTTKTKDGSNTLRVENLKNEMM